MEDKNIIAIEIGSSKVRGAIGVYSPSGVLTVTAVEEEPTLDCVRYGAVSNVEEVAMAATRIIRKLENRVSPRKVTSVYVAMGGRSFASMSRTVEETLDEECEINDVILARLDDASRIINYSDREVLELIPGEYVVDRTVVSKPKGTVGRNIRMTSNLITCRSQLKRNIDRLLREKMQLNIAGYKVRQLAIADTVLTDQEKRLGCMLVDFGAETTTVSIYRDGTLQYLATLPLGSRNITRDIKHMHVVEEKAEELKRTIGSADSSGLVDTSAFGSGVDYSDINKYVSHRAGEIIANIARQLEYANLSASDLPEGIIIVGGGSQLKDFNDRLAKTLGMKLRVGSAINQNIRYNDSRISPTVACDVVSVLYSAAADGMAEECLTIPVVAAPQPVVVEPQRPVVVEQTPVPAVEVEEVVEERTQPAAQAAASSQPKSNKFKKFFDSLKDRTARMMSDDGDEDLIDD